MTINEIRRSVLIELEVRSSQTKADTMRHLALAATLVAGTVIGTAATAAAADPTDGLVITEIHYDNASSDVGEFVEVAGLACTT